MTATTFTYRPWPLRVIFLLYTGLSLVVRIPYWAITALRPSWRPRPTWGIVRHIRVRIIYTVIDALHQTALPVPEDNEKAAATADKTGFVWLEPIPDELLWGEVRDIAKLNEVVPARISGYWYGARGEKGAVGQKANPGEKVVLWLHGGGYVLLSARPTDKMCPLMCNGIIDNSDSLIKRVFAVDYRLTSAEPFQPANAFPAQLIDALAGYRYLLNTLGFEPANIIIGGDSAGANLTIALTRYLVASTSPALPTPGAALLVSPAGEWLLTHGDGPDSSWVRNQKSDYVEPFFRGYSARGLLGKLPPDDVYTNAWISPSSLRISKPDGIYEKFPRTCVVVGEGEIMMDAFQTLRERIVADIGEGNVTWIEEFGGTHDFVGLPFEPERTRAWKKVGEWAKTL